RFRGQRLQMNFRGFVRAMLVPHRREDTKLGERRLAADQFEDTRIFLRLEAVLGDELRRDLGLVGTHAIRSSGIAFQRSDVHTPDKPRSADSAMSIHSACARRTCFGARLVCFSTSSNTSLASA